MTDRLPRRAKRHDDYLRRGHGSCDRYRLRSRRQSLRWRPQRTIFKISRDRQIFVFATIEPSIAAYHLAFGNNGNLYITGPTTSSFDAVHQVDPHGEVSEFYRGLGRPQELPWTLTTISMSQPRTMAGAAL